MISSVIGTFLVRFISAVLNFLVVVLLSQYLGPEGKGICTRYITIIANALIFCDFIGGPPLVYLSAKYRTPSLLWPSYLWSALTSALTIYIFMLFDLVAPAEYGYLVILSFLNSAIAIHQNILSGKMKFLRLNLVLLLQSALLFLSLRYFVGLSVAEFTIGPSPIFYILSLGISWGLSALLGYIFVITLEKSGEDISVRRFLSEAYRYGFTNITGHALQFINQRLSYFLLSRKALGVFSNASSVGESLWLVSGSMATVQYGRVSNLSDKKQREDLTLLFLKLNLMLCSIGGLIMFFVPETFYVWVFGKDFFGIGSLLAVLIPGLIFFSGYLILGHHFSGCGEFKKNIYCIVTGLIITVLGIAIIYFSRAEFSIRAAALITSLSYLGNFCSALFIFSRDASLSLKQVLPRYSDFILFANQIRFPRKK